MNLKKATNAISKIIIDAISSEESMHQPLVDEVVKIFDGLVQRCVLYFFEEINEETGYEVYCRITAGYPNNKKEHGIGDITLVEDHEDLMEVLKLDDLMHIKDPRNDPVTIKFRDHIKCKNISEIVYLPIFYGDYLKRIVGIIVIDALDKKKFTDEEIGFFRLVGDRISSGLHLSENFINHIWDKKNSVIGLTGFSKRIKKKQACITCLSHSIGNLIPDNNYPTEVDFSRMCLLLQRIQCLATNSMELAEILQLNLSTIEKDRPRGEIMKFGKKNKPNKI